MLQVRELDLEEWHVVTNRADQILIYTTSSSIAHFINNFTPTLNNNLRLNVGGDPGTKSHSDKRIFHHVRRYRR